MGRRRKITLSDLEDRILDCKCGRHIHVEDKNVTSVTCVYCLTKSVPYSLMTEEQIEEVDVKEQEQINANQNKPVKLSKNGKPLGRPRKNQPKTPDYFEEPTKKKAQSKEMDAILRKASKLKPVESEKPTKVKPATGETKTTKVKVKSVKKGKSIMDNKKRGKRGRKPTVGAKVLSYITNQNGNVEFQDILKVYSEEREKLGKKATPKIEERNCRSTLYILVRDGKLREVNAKKTYSTM